LVYMVAAILTNRVMKYIAFGHPEYLSIKVPISGKLN
jgi:hypothetical protein